jgi:putative spermidine/putrescine transport system permease protein
MGTYRALRLSDIRGDLTQVLLLIPALVYVGLIFLTALAIMLATAFFQYRFPQIVDQFTLENFERFFTVSLYLDSLYVTVRIAGITSLLSLLLGYPVAYSLARSRSGLERTVLFVGVLISLFVGIIERIYAWILILQDSGIANQLLARLGLSQLHLMYNEGGIIIASTHFLLSYAIFTLMGSIQSVNPSLEEAALSLGASRVRTFIDVTLPLTLPGILSCILLTFSLGMSAFVIPMLMGGGVVWMLSNMIYDRVVLTGNVPFGCAIALILLFVSIASTQLVTVLMTKKIQVG